MIEEQRRIEQALAAWNTIEAWLEEHAPRSYQRLPAPATEEEIQAVEQDLDLAIPADLRAFYRTHNGTGPADCFNWPRRGDAQTPEDQWGGYLFPDGGVGPLQKMEYWSRYEREQNPQQRYLPFIASDPDGLYGLFADCIPGEGYGRLGRYAEADEPFRGAWPSFAAYLTEVANALHERRSIHNSRYIPGTVGQSLRWDTPEAPAKGWEPVLG